MGVSDWFSALYESVTEAASSLAPNDVYAEAAPAKEEADSEDGAEEEGEEKEDAEEAEEEEEEEEEPVDPKPRLEEECMRTKECYPAKHHYDECVERVTGKIESDGKADEDCVEEFFHLIHCASACAAPKLWKELK